MAAYDPTTGMATSSNQSGTGGDAGAGSFGDTSSVGAATTDPTMSQPLGGTTSYDAEGEGQGIGQTARQVAEGVAAAAGDVTARIPEVAQSARGAWEEADRLVHRGSDSTLQLVGAASVGFAVGLLVGGAHRLLVILSLIPAALIGATIIERMERGDSWSEVLDSDTLVQGG